jgi:hypothetical protein
MPLTTSPRRTGVISNWKLSPSGGWGTVLDLRTGETFFICRPFIKDGDPQVGCSVTFSVRPALEGKRHPQAVDCVIDNGRAIRALDVKKITAIDVLSSKVTKVGA